MDVPDLPSRLVSDLMRASADDEPERETELLEEAAGSGASIVPDLARTLEAAYDLDDDVAFDVRMFAEDLIVAANVREGFEALFRDLAARGLDEADDAIDRFAGDERFYAGIEHALALREDAVEAGDEAVREVCSIVLAYAEPGARGVLDALLDEHRRHPELGLGLLGRHGDERAGPVLLTWLRGLDVTNLGAVDRMIARDVAVALVDWNVALDDTERTSVEAVIEMACDDLAWENKLLRDDIAANDDMIAALRGRLPGRLRPASAGRKPGRNQPCPCGSGKKSKLCCG